MKRKFTTHIFTGIISLIIGVLLCSKCTSTEGRQIGETKIERDTVYITKYDTLQTFLPTPSETKFITLNTITTDTALIAVLSKRIKELEEQGVDITDVLEVIEDTIGGEVIEVNVYNDTLRGDGVDVYHEAVVAGTLLSNDLSYKLETKEVTVTKTKSVANKGLYFTFDLGTDFNNGLTETGLGMMYVTKKRPAFYYRANVRDITNVTHTVGIGIRITK